MDANIDAIEQRAGKNNRYQSIIFVLAILIWISNCLVINMTPFLETRPDIQIRYKDNNNVENFKISAEFCEIYNKKINKKHINNDFDIIKLSTYDEIGYSMSIYFNFFCNSFKLGIFNACCYTGSIFGNILNAVISNIYGRKISLLIGLAGNIIASFLIIFSINYEMLCISIFLFNFTGLNNIISSILFVLEIVSISNRNMYNSLVNSGNFICILIYISIFYVFNSWKIGFIYNIVLTTISLIYVNSFVIESPKTYLRNKNFDKYIKCLIKVSEINNRKQAFEQFLANNNAKHYIENYNSLESCNNLNNSNTNTNTGILISNCLSNKEDTVFSHNKDTINKVDISNNSIKFNFKKSNDINLKNENINVLFNKSYIESKSCSENFLPINGINNKTIDQTIKSLSFNNTNINTNLFKNSYLIKSKNEIYNSMIEIIDFQDLKNQIENTTNGKKNISLCKIFKYKSQVKIFTIMSICFFGSIGLFFSNTVSLKNLDWSIFYLGYVDVGVQAFSTVVCYYMAENIYLGRRLSNFFLCWLLVLLISLEFFNFSNIAVLIINFSVKFCLTGISTTIYVHANELYPNSIKNTIFGINICFAKFSIVFFTFIVEIIKPIYSKIIFLSISLCMAISYFFLDETLGQSTILEIPEIVEERIKNKQNSI